MLRMLSDPAAAMHFTLLAALTSAIARARPVTQHAEPIDASTSDVGFPRVVREGSQP